jgi:hypothetical protein
LATLREKIVLLTELIERRNGLLRLADVSQRERVAAELEARVMESRLAYQRCPVVTSANWLRSRGSPYGGERSSICRTG